MLTTFCINPCSQFKTPKSSPDLAKSSRKVANMPGSFRQRSTYCICLDGSRWSSNTTPNQGFRPQDCVTCPGGEITETVRLFIHHVFGEHSTESFDSDGDWGKRSDPMRSEFENGRRRWFHWSRRKHLRYESECWTSLEIVSAVQRMHLEAKTMFL